MGIFQKPNNDVNQVLKYEDGSKERVKLLEMIELVKKTPAAIPLIINGKEIHTGILETIKCPHDHSLILAQVHLARKSEMMEAISSALDAQSKWSDLPWFHRAAIFRKAADIMAGPKRIECIATIMLNLSKTPYEAEIDLAELVDFWRYNAYFLERIYSQQPDQYAGEINRFDWRPLEGFVVAIPPFNFFSIAGNLPTAPAMVGNVVLWKPAHQVYLASYKIMQILLEAGIPPGVITFLPFTGAESPLLFEHQAFAGLHFTGSYETLTYFWQTIGSNFKRYRNIPRIVAESGGKDFIFIHKSADLKNVAMNVIRGAFEYQGQKCSACSRVYVPSSLWGQLKKILLSQVPALKYGPTEDLSCAMGAIIDEVAFNKVTGYIEFARQHPSDYDFVCGGISNNNYGWFIAPTIIQSKTPQSKLMSEEIFGPVVTIYVYPDEQYEATLSLCNVTSPYGLTGAIFGTDRIAISQAEQILRHAAGNFYINDKPTGAIVGRQPFGGGRASGTNNKAGSFLNLLCWLSPRAIKESFLPVTDWRRPHMQ